MKDSDLSSFSSTRRKVTYISNIEEEKRWLSLSNNKLFVKFRLIDYLRRLNKEALSGFLDNIESSLIIEEESINKTVERTDFIRKTLFLLTSEEEKKIWIGYISSLGFEIPEDLARIYEGVKDLEGEPLYCVAIWAGFKDRENFRSDNRFEKKLRKILKKFQQSWVRESLR